jgi:hypothetical protein
MEREGGGGRERGTSTRSCFRTVSNADSLESSFFRAKKKPTAAAAPTDGVAIFSLIQPAY